MMLAAVLAWSLSCAPVNAARAHGYTDAQIEAYARAHDVPEFVIKWARNHCH